MTPSLEQCLHRAVALATERHHEFATLEHLLLSLTGDQDAASVFLACEIDLDRLRSELTGYIDSSKLDNLVTAESGPAKPTTAFQRVVQRAVLHVQNSGRAQVTGANVLVALFTEFDSHAVNILRQQGMTGTDAVSYITHGITKPREGDQSG
jgi:ATP-dependent Clp protease ATP-binding subunit ClpA